MYPWEILKFWLISIFWQDTVVSRIFTCASHHTLNIQWQPWKCSLQRASQFPQNDKKEAEGTFTGIRQVECIANFLGFLSLNFNPRNPSKTSCISRVLKYTAFMNKERTYRKEIRDPQLINFNVLFFIKIYFKLCVIRTKNCSWDGFYLQDKYI